MTGNTRRGYFEIIETSTASRLSGGAAPREERSADSMNIKSAIESILFLHGEPMASSRLAKIIGAPKKDVEAALQELRVEYRDRGMVLIQNDEEWQFASNASNKSVVEKLYTHDLPDELTPTTLEVLALVAYKGPITRASIEYVRGVNCSFTLRNLLIRGLVEREENPKDRRAYLYRVSNEFLKHLGLGELGELPRYADFRKTEIEPPPEEGVPLSASAPEEKYVLPSDAA